MIFGYTKVRAYLPHIECNLLRTAVVIGSVNHFNKSSLKAVTWFPDL